MSTQPSEDDEPWTPGEAGAASDDVIPLARPRPVPRPEPPPELPPEPVPPPIPEVFEATARPRRAIPGGPNAAEFAARERSLRDPVALVLLAPLGWWTLRAALGGEFWCFLDNVNLAFHEAGHLFLAPFGSTLHILGGTLAQLAVPAVLGVWLYWREQRRVLPAALCLWWFGENLVNVARYMADARELALPLVGGGDHDWNEILYRWGLLTEPDVRSISGATHATGLLVMLAGLAAVSLRAFPRLRRSEPPVSSPPDGGDDAPPSLPREET